MSFYRICFHGSVSICHVLFDFSRNEYRTLVFASDLEECRECDDLCGTDDLSIADCTLQTFFQALCAVGFVREGIGGPIASALVTRIFKITYQSNYYTLGGELDALNPMTGNLSFPTYFGELQRQTMLVSIKEVFGYAVLFGILLLLFILITRYTRVVHRIKLFRVPVVGRLFAINLSRERLEDTV